MSIERKNNVTYRFPKVNMSSLLQLYERSTLSNNVKFKEEFGRIAVFLNAPMNEHQEKAIHTLLQFYDPPLRCFAFLDYQLAPTLEEFSNLLDIPIKPQIPFHMMMESLNSEQIAAILCLNKSDVEVNLKIKGGLHGFQLDFLLNKAHLAADRERWDVFNVLLACSTYGIVLFHNVANFVDMNAIQIFAQRNPVPTLLGDFYHSIHTRNKKKGGLVWCCAQLLYIWFKSHLPTEGAFIDTKDTLRWSGRLMGLTSKDIKWFEVSLARKENLEVICSCGEFPNVPLLGIRGGINYNPTLLKRQFGFTLKIPPDEKELVESFFFTIGDDEGILKRAVRAWSHIRYKGKLHFGKRDCVAYSPYASWIVDRVASVGLPFPKVKPLYPEEPENPDLVSKGDFEKLVSINKSLKREREEMSLQVYEARQKKMEMVHKVKTKNELIRKIKKRPRDDSSGEGSSKMSKNYLKKLEETEKKFVAKGGECDKVKATLRKERLSYKAKIRSLEKQLEEERTRRAGVEIQLKESHVHLDQATRQISSLRDRLHLEEGAPIPIPLPQCKECDRLIDHFLYLKATVAQKDELIKTLVRRQDPKETKKMFEESKAWSKRNLCEGGPLAGIEWED